MASLFYLLTFENNIKKSNYEGILWCCASLLSGPFLAPFSLLSIFSCSLEAQFGSSASLSPEPEAPVLTPQLPTAGPLAWRGTSSSWLSPARCHLAEVWLPPSPTSLEVGLT